MTNTDSKEKAATTSATSGAKMRSTVHIQERMEAHLRIEEGLLQDLKKAKTLDESRLLFKMAAEYGTYARALAWVLNGVE